jgi:hypothetical protein
LENLENENMPDHTRTQMGGAFVAKQRMIEAMAAVLCGLFPIASGCADDMNTLPIATIASKSTIASKYGQAISKVAAKDGPTIVSVAVPETPTDTNPRFLTRFVLLNPLNVPITYYGYRMDAWQDRPPIGEISPLYTTQTRKPADKGKWKRGEVGWCGTGADTMVVKPGHAGRFYAYLPLDVSDCKVIVECKWNENGKSVTKVISSRSVESRPLSPKVTSRPADERNEN